MFRKLRILNKHLLISLVSVTIFFCIFPLYSKAERTNYKIPTEYYQNKKLGYVLHWIKPKGTKSTCLLLFGDFKRAIVSYGLTNSKLNFECRSNIYANYDLPEEKKGKKISPPRT